MACLPARYKLVELLCYIVMGFFPALVILSMVSAASPAWMGPCKGPRVSGLDLAVEIVTLSYGRWGN